MSILHRLCFASLLLVIFDYGHSQACSLDNVPRVDPTICCDLEDILDKNIISDCKSEFGDPMRQVMETGNIPHGGCFSECFLNASGIMKNGAVVATEAVKYISGKIPDGKMTDVIGKVVSTCVSLISKNEADYELFSNLPPHPYGQRMCNPRSGHFIGCILSNLFQNCPDTRWVSRPECEDLRDYIRKCPYPFPVRA